jgi:MarR family transcriptional regulator, multiple antibiotic resistance protein MarR
MPWNVLLRLYAMATTSASRDLGQFFDDLVRSETRLYNAVGEALRAEHGIVTSQFELLRFVRDHSDCRVAEIATYFAAGVGAISKGCDRLEARGWMMRTPNPADGRSSLLRLTDDGAQLVADADRTFRRHLNALISPVLGQDELDAVSAAIATLRTALQSQSIGTPAG